MRIALRILVMSAFVVLLVLAFAPIVAVTAQLLAGPSGAGQGSPGVGPSLYNSVILAVVVGLLAGAGGTILGVSYSLAGVGRAGALLATLALVMPEVPAADGLRQFFGSVGFRSSGLTMVGLGQAWFPTALTSVLVYLRLSALSAPALTQTARLLGGKWRHVAPIIARMVWPVAAVGGLSAAAFSLQDVVYPLFLGSSQFAPMPSVIYAAARFGVQSWMLWYGLLVLAIGTVISVALVAEEVRRDRT